MLKQKLEKIKKSFLENKPVIVFDAENRENEADFIIPADCLTVQAVNFIITKGKGLLCTAITKKRQKELGLELMTNTNDSQFYTNFTVSVDLNSPEVTTGITALERFLTIQALGNKNFTATDFSKPGHIFPLVAQDGLLETRKGHTEATIELCLLTGYYPCGALIEVLNEEGGRGDLEYCQKLNQEFGLEILNIEDLLDLK